MRDVSIEYAHIYTNNKIGEEQQLTLKILGELGKEEKGEMCSLVVMVDDYSFPDTSFSYDTFLAWLRGEGFTPDIVFRESQLIPSCDEVLHMVKDEKLRGQLEDYIKAKKYPCSLFIAAWYLIRLGYITHPLFNKKFAAKKLINILPQSFKPFEDKGLEIMAATHLPGCLERVTYRYFEGRLVA